MSSFKVGNIVRGTITDNIYLLVEEVLGDSKRFIGLVLAPSYKTDTEGDIKSLLHISNFDGINNYNLRGEQPMAGDTILITKSFAGIEKGEQLKVLVIGEGAYKVEKAGGVIAFVPKSNASLLKGSSTDPSVLPKSIIEIGNQEILIPQPTADISKEELTQLKDLLYTSGKIETKGIKATSAKTEENFTPPKSPEEVLTELKAKELAEIRDKLAGPLDPKDILKVNTFRLSDLTNGRLPESGIDHTIQAYPEDYFSTDMRGDIPDVMLEYYWDADVLEAIYLAYFLDEKILITGLPGTGKTTGIQQFAAHVQQPYMRFNGKDGIEQSSFLGYPWATSSGMEWKDGLLPQGCKSGYLVCIDEVFKIPAGIQMAMQNLYEKGGTLMLDDKPGEYHEKLVVPAPEFRLMLTDNVRGTGDNFEKFASTQMQDTSTLDRFGITIEQDYLPPGDEVKMLANMYPTQTNTDINQLVKLAGLVRSGYKSGEIALTLSPRGLMASLYMMSEGGVPLTSAIQLAFTNKLADENEIQAVQQFFSTVGI